MRIIVRHVNFHGAELTRETIEKVENVEAAFPVIREFGTLFHGDHISLDFFDDEPERRGESDG